MRQQKQAQGQFTTCLSVHDSASCRYTQRFLLIPAHKDKRKRQCNRKTCFICGAAKSVANVLPISQQVVQPTAAGMFRGFRLSFASTLSFSWPLPGAYTSNRTAEKIKDCPLAWNNSTIYFLATSFRQVKAHGGLGFAPRPARLDLAGRTPISYDANHNSFRIELIDPRDRSAFWLLRCRFLGT
jgi:hypothetical protein